MVKKEVFGSVNGKCIYKYTVYRNGAEFSVINYGATLVNVCVPDKNGYKTDLILGFDSIDEYVKNRIYSGATIGRVAGRIGNACFDYCGKYYQLEANDGINTLHGGNCGFDKYIWDSYTDNEVIVMSLESREGDCGFFGNLNVRAEFFWDDNRGLNIVYTAVTDTESAVNLTNSAYFNLNGAGFGDVLQHRALMYSSTIAALDDAMVATGEFLPVKGTPFDFSVEKTIAGSLCGNHPQLTVAGGIDHYFYADEKLPTDLVAVVTGDKSGIIMETYTNQIGFQFCSGDFLGNFYGKGGKIYKKNYGFGIEPQSFPNALNVPEFGSPVIRCGETYRNQTVYRFSSIS